MVVERMVPLMAVTMAMMMIVMIGADEAWVLNDQQGW